MCGWSLIFVVLVLIKKHLKIVEGNGSMLKVECEEGPQKSPFPVGNKWKLSLGITNPYGLDK